MTDEQARRVHARPDPDARAPSVRVEAAWREDVGRAGCGGDDPEAPRAWVRDAGGHRPDVRARVGLDGEHTRHPADAEDPAGGRVQPRAVPGDPDRGVPAAPR